MSDPPASAQQILPDPSLVFDSKLQAGRGEDFSAAAIVRTTPPSASLPHRA